MYSDLFNLQKAMNNKLNRSVLNDMKNEQITTFEANDSSEVIKKYSGIKRNSAKDV